MYNISRIPSCILVCLLAFLGCSHSDNAEIAKAKAEAAAASEAAASAKAELEKVQATPVVTPAPKISREQAIANIEKLGGKIEYEKNSTDGPISTIRLDNKRFTDDDLANLQPLNDAVVLSIANSAVTDAGLQHLEGMTRLTKLSLYLSDRIDGSGFGALKSLHKLSSLTLHGTRVGDQALALLQGMSDLGQLNLIGCPITDAGLEQLGAKPKLWYLDISKTKVTDNGLKLLGSSPNLTHLYLAGLPITDAGLEHLKGNSKLQSLAVQNTMVTEAGVKKLQESLPSLQVAR